MAKQKTLKETPKPWWKILLCQIIGTVFILLPILIYIGLIDYHASDPSFNKVTSESTVVQNCLGLFGAYAADAVLRSFGLALIIFLIIPVFWGINLWRFHAFAEYKTRIFAWIVGILSFSCFIDLTCSKYLGVFDLPYNLAGEWSRVLSRPLNTYINMLNFKYNSYLLEGIILFISIISFNFAAGVTFKYWLNLCKKTLRFCKAIITLLVAIFKKIANIRNFREFKEINPSYLQNKMHSRLNSFKTRYEPAFEHNEPPINRTISQPSPQFMAQTSVLQTSAARAQNFSPNKKSSLTIEMPQAQTSVGNLALNSEPEFAAKPATFSPTFDFINDDNLVKAKAKPRHNSASETYQAANTDKTVKPEQTELLDVPNTGEALTNKKPQSQTPSGVLPVKNSNEYILPDINLLTAPKQPEHITVDEATLKSNALKLEQVLNDFGIKGQIVKVRPGPVVTLYELEPAPGTRTARVIGLSDDIARSMSAVSVRMAVVSGHNTIGIELPNVNRQTVWLRELLEGDDFKQNKNILNVALGKDIGGQHVYADLSKMPHLLVAGTTGSGKSVGVNSMILSLLYRMTPEQCKFIMIDPKQLEFSMYNGIPHLLTPVITDPAKAVVGLKWAVQEMESRYRSMALLNVRNIAGYNKKVAEMNKQNTELKKTIQTGFDKETGQPIYEEQVIDTSPMPYIVIVVDEMADLMLVAGKEVEAAIQRLAQMARAAGIHLIMSTQRPSVDVITGVIKANFPSRLSFHVTTRGDSITILGEKGAEQLLGMGDMLYMPSGLRPIRVHGCFVPDDEVEKIVEFIKSQGEPQYVSEVTAGELTGKDSGPVFDKGEFAGSDAEEDLYMQALEIVREEKKASTSYIQRKLRIGYNRAANLIERMEREGIVSKQDHVGRREVLID